MKSRYLVAVAGLLAAASAFSLARRAGSAPAADAGPTQVAAPVASAPGAWLTDADEGAATAVKTGKDLLVDFATANPADSNDLNSEAFRRAAGDKFVLVRLRSSADSDPETASRVAAWGERLGVSEFPTLVALDTKGRPYADAAGQKKDADAAIKILSTLAESKSKRDSELATAAKANGAERAKHLDAALKSVGRFATSPAYLEVMREIVTLDKENVAGFKAQYASIVSGIDVDRAIQADVYPMIDKGDLAGAIKRIDQIMVEAQPAANQKQLLLAFKGQLYFSLHDAPSATKAFDEAVKIDPKSETAAKVLAARQQVMGGNS